MEEKRVGQDIYEEAIRLKQIMNIPLEADEVLHMCYRGLGSKPLTSESRRSLMNNVKKYGHKYH